nr:hypothetical protein [Actinomycetota bacterium]
MSPAVALGGSRGGAATASLTEVDGRRVAWFALGGGKHRGAIGPVEGDVIERAVRMALELGVPIVGELATSGADVYEGLPSLHAWGKTAAALSEASGAVPIVFSVVGPCVSGPALLLGLADHVVMTSEAFAYVCGPATVAEFTGVSMTRSDLGGASVHDRLSGVASLLVTDQEDARAAVED